MDDSGGIEPLVRWDGTYIPGDHPLTLLAGIFVHEAELPEFNSAWKQLQADIQVALGCPDPPPIHMRIMWGRNLKKNYRNRPNPYVGADFEQIKEWVRRAFEIILAAAEKPKRVAVVGAGRIRRLESQRLAEFFRHPVHMAEMEFLRQASRGRHKKMYAGFHKRLTSPLLPMLFEVISTLEMHMRTVKQASLELLIDPFGDSHGVDAQRVVSAMSEVMELERLSSIQRVGNTDEVPLCQAADLIGFSNFRGLMHDKGFIKYDEHLLPIWNDFVGRLRPFTVLDVHDLLRRNFSSLPAKQLAAHYALARNAIETRHQEFVDQHLVTVQEFLNRAMAAASDDVGVPILKDFSVCQHLLSETT
ncbi:MAG TPA: hypothetical protein VF168_00500 [Trueperaceae bacterium]